MTIIARNRLIKSGIAVSAIFSALTVAAFILLCLDTEQDISENLIRFIDLSDNTLFSFNFYAASAAVLALTLAGTLTLLRVYFFFEKTPSIEITFFSAGLIAVSAECVRLLVPFFSLWETQPFMLVLISRTVLFIRVFFILTVLAGAVFANGKTMQKSGVLLFFIAIAAFFTATGIPVNYSELGSTFLLLPGYSGMLSLISVLLLLIACFSFFLQAKAFSIPEYYKTAAGCFCLSLGWISLCLCDCWALFASGTVLFLAGVCFYTQSLHKHYLWQ